jgi:hypothetical protein
MLKNVRFHGKARRFSETLIFALVKSPSKRHKGFESQTDSHKTLQKPLNRGKRRGYNDKR